MRSHLLTGTLRHRRTHPVSYDFRHRVWYLALDLDEIDSVVQHLAPLSHNGRNLLEFRDRDHFQDRHSGGEIAELARTALDEALPDVPAMDRENWRTTLITYPRVLGYVFNPASFYLHHDAAGRLRHAVAEVSNTHGEQHLYDLPREGEGGPVYRSHAPKSFYVSPFIGPRADYDFRVAETADGMTLALNESQDGVHFLHAGLRLERRPLSNRSLLALLAREPWVTAKTITAIHRHALGLCLRGAPFFRHRPARESVS